MPRQLSEPSGRYSGPIRLQVVPAWQCLLLLGSRGKTVTLPQACDILMTAEWEMLPD